MSQHSLDTKSYSPYITFNREEWKRLRDATPLSLREADLMKLRGLNEQISLEEVAEIYLPLSRLLNLHVGARQELYNATYTFLNNRTQKVPYIIGIGGSVAVGKSTTARILQALLARWPNHPKVELVTTDGFLYPNRILEQRGIMKRKGFPESYDVRKLIEFMARVKSGDPEVKAPVYSHLAYDIVPGEYQIVRQPDIVIVEGLNVLQIAKGTRKKHTPQVFVSDFFDFSIYVDAREQDIANWYVERFKMLRHTAFQKAESYFHRYANLTDEEAVSTATRIWREINLLNLRENIVPTKDRAQLILEKAADHSVQRVMMRKL
ncbi:type I pantothenate kinase [Brevibacillus humidisoli]|uniref:type I pantothenate kinase n=1 Tax=Brevibacillus humidisoli TaxID=2895522 RepID=UPI001E506309|nr:type I pantothenate kinase [Brevibacillus humidisoli]UFJ43236.1 type I pantothenate kinase [Brevibacillus humidisoli]